MTSSRNVIYLVADSMRPDYLGCYGNDNVLTTEIDQLAADGVLFENVVSAAPWTVPSVASHLTGAYPHRFGIFSPEFDVSEAPIKTVFDRFNRNGYSTAAFLDSERLHDQWSQEVDHTGMALDIQDILNYISERAASDEPFYLFSLYRGTHLPYLLKYSKESFDRGLQEGMDKLRYGGEEGVEETKYRYARSIENFSEWYLGAILDRLETEGIRDETAIIVTADHGESWVERVDDHESLDIFDLHGSYLYREVLNVPLVMENFGSIGGKHVEEIIRSIDTIPTMFDALRMDEEAASEGLHGMSLAPLLKDGESTVEYPEYAFSSTTAYENPGNGTIDVISKFSVVRDNWKLIWNPDEDDLRLYDHKTDPDEKIDVSDNHPDITSELLEVLKDEMQASRQAMQTEGTSDEVRNRLEDLGYL
jgi:arylsulfatase A-like enzyme